jgi:hypothetical protein
LKDLLPFFQDSSSSAETSSLLQDHPLQNGRVGTKESSSPPLIPEKKKLHLASLITDGVVEATASVVISDQSREQKNPPDFSNQSTISVSKSRTKTIFSCKICHFESKYKTICVSHIETCLRKEEVLENGNEQVSADEDDAGDLVNEEDARNLDDEDLFFNYKNGEFFIDSIFATMTIFEKFGDGVGCLIVSKILLPIFHGLNHNNYTSSIHRFVTRILCEANPREGLKLVHERFSN